MTDLSHNCKAWKILAAAFNQCKPECQYEVNNFQFYIQSLTSPRLI